MFDKELIKKICDLTCKFEEINIPQDKLKYDNEYPFEKYYKLEIIVNAIKKYLNKDWDDKMLSSWACRYDWVICGGFYEDLKENNKNIIEEFIRSQISWKLDGLSFFEDWFLEEDAFDLNKTIEEFENLDFVLNTIDNWKAYYAMVGPLAKENEDQYVLLINELDKKYMIIYSMFFENGYEDEFIKFISEEELKQKIKELEKSEYTLLSYSEQFYYDEA
ncbi:MAG: hypothetical protein J1F32_06230 [Erysipelotrichales bacterium]|nr:hypothetical protein [Erysipelotrichales bacterium]